METVERQGLPEAGPGIRKQPRTVSSEPCFGQVGERRKHVSRAGLDIALMFMLSTVAGCAHVQTSPTNLSGDWTLQLNSGEAIPVSIRQVDLSNIFINADQVQISGRYSLIGNNLTLLKANQPRISGVEFIGKDDGSWVMVEAPSAARIGYQLGGSFLTKIIN